MKCDYISQDRISFSFVQVKKKKYMNQKKKQPGRYTTVNRINEVKK